MSRRARPRTTSTSRSWKSRSPSRTSAPSSRSSSPPPDPSRTRATLRRVTEDSRADALLRRDRAVVLAGLLAVSLVAWLYLVHVAHEMGGTDMAAMPGMVMTTGWSARKAGLALAMWVAMMV